MKKTNENPLAKIPQTEKILNEYILKETIKKIGKPNVAKAACLYLEKVRKEALLGKAVPSITECAEEVKKLCIPICANVLHL